MSSLKKIIAQQLVVDKERQKLKLIEDEYTESVRKYSNGQLVEFDYLGGIPKYGKIKEAWFRDSPDYIGIVYAILIHTKKGERSKSDTSRYIVEERHIITNHEKAN